MSSRAPSPQSPYTNDALLYPLLRRIDDLERRLKGLEIGGETPTWTAFTPVWKHGGSTTITLDSLSWGYYRLDNGKLEIELWLRADSGSAGGAGAHEVSGWPTAYNIAGRAARILVGRFRFYDKNIDVAFKGDAVSYYDTIACEPTEPGADTPADAYNQGNRYQVLLGQANSGWAGGVEIDDELSVRASWRI